MAALSLACSIPQRVGRPSLVPARWIGGSSERSAVSPGQPRCTRSCGRLPAMTQGWSGRGRSCGCSSSARPSARCWRGPSTGGGPAPCHTGAGLSGRRCCSRPSSCRTPSTWRTASRAARRSTPRALRQMDPERRHPILLAALAAAHREIVDETVRLFDMISARPTATPATRSPSANSMLSSESGASRAARRHPRRRSRLRPRRQRGRGRRAGTWPQAARERGPQRGGAPTA